ncbi:superinfection immunity protein [Natranaerofaba carboxydovora]|uniref:superinfection immunity protein n=1 Tax=Natranaerofaba carboxydovora TaxID=2742683 RepID=UPI001F146C51|nr:superinfection immunity protein [Natranaerofaba carboxydovora]UMZ72549.1 Superinfection immunity protein [Natranaerofaba carboxydovora]
MKLVIITSIILTILMTIPTIYYDDIFESDAGFIMSTLTGFIVITVIVTIYLIPTLVAEYRNHRNVKAISVLNLFLGWTFIFWVLALVWAFLNNQEEPAQET